MVRLTVRANGGSMNNNEIPTVKVRAREVTIFNTDARTWQTRWEWVFSCPHCIYRRKRVTHVHGAGDGVEPALLGHRVAHCFDEASPYRERGYMLVAE